MTRRVVDQLVGEEKNRPGPVEGFTSGRGRNRPVKGVGNQLAGEERIGWPSSRGEQAGQPVGRGPAECSTNWRERERSVREG